MPSFSRRSFLKTSAMAGAAAFVPGSRVLGANGDVRIAIIGLNGKGAHHVSVFRNLPGARIVALCDADQAVLDREAKKLQNEKVQQYVDVRKLLDDRNVDAVVIATPNHWHSLMTVWACQAGKDVYVEKPLSHNIWEGRRAVEAARRYNRIVQVGMQSRSDVGVQQIHEYLRKGELGKILFARGFCYKRRESIGKVDGPQPIPSTVDYDLWCGPAPKGPLMRKRLHYDWHWVWPTGNGDIGNQGIHEMDLCRWMIGQDVVAPKAMSFGGRFAYIDDGQTPNTQVAVLDYKPAPIIFEVRGLPRKTKSSAMDNYRGIQVGEVIQCEHGYIAGSFAYDNDNRKIKQFDREGGSRHHSNFIEAIRSRKSSDLNADVEQGHLSAVLFHMANISFRLGQEAARSGILSEIGNSAELKDSLERFQEHLLVNEANVNQTPRILGPWLDFDAKTERFTGELAEKANAMVKDEYRAPYVIPDQV